MSRHLLLAFGLVLTTACASTLTGSDSGERLALHVDGFVKAEGITWLGWPNRVQGALDGHPGIHEVSFDIEAERFDIVFDGDQMSRERILEIIEDLGYEPKVVDEDSGATAGIVSTRVSIDELPEEFRDLFAEARRLDRPVLFDFTAPGWIACEKMDTVTYPNSGVQAELEHWVFRKVDVTEQRDMAQAFQVTAIPIAIAVTGDGRTLERIPNFVEPGPFGEALREVRASR